MKYLLDTNTCVYLFADSQPELSRRVAGCEAGQLAISAIVLAELEMGAAKGYGPPRDVLDAFLAEIPVLPFDEAAARIYGTLPFRRGRFDRLLAAHALALGLPLVTRNRKDFADLPALTIHDWTRA